MVLDGTGSVYDDTGWYLVSISWHCLVKVVHRQQRACMPVYIGKSGDLVGCYRSLTHWQTTEYSATQLVSSINHKLSHAIFFRYQSIKGVQYFLKEAHHAPKSIYASMQSKLNISHPKHTKKRFCVNRSSLNQTGGKLSYLWTYICWCHHMSHIVHICREIQHLQVWNWIWI